MTGPAAPLADRRLLLVHAHPDDETINNGASMAKYVSEGAHVTLVTCTLGEEGEILIPGVEQDDLGDHRRGELAAAMAALGVTDHRFLGGAGKYRDSGMVWGDDGHATAGADIHPEAFWAADLVAAANDLVPVIREVRPQVLVTYDEFGNYGHPDHIQAHRVAMYAAQLAGARSYRPDLGEPWTIAKIYWAAMSLSLFADGMKHLEDSAAQFDRPFTPPPSALPDDQLDARIDGNPWVEDKLAAMRAHASQIEVDGPFFALSNHLGNEVWGYEFYRLVAGEPGPRDADGFETDLFG